MLCLLVTAINKCEMSLKVCTTNSKRAFVEAILSACKTLVVCNQRIKRPQNENFQKSAKFNFHPTKFVIIKIIFTCYLLAFLFATIISAVTATSAHRHHRHHKLISLAGQTPAALVLNSNHTLALNATTWPKTYPSKSLTATLANSTLRQHKKNEVVSNQNKKSIIKNEVIYPIISSASTASTAVYTSTATRASTIFNVSATSSVAAFNDTKSNDIDDDVDEVPELPSYIRTTAMCFCIIIMLMGVIGNVMVPIVIVRTKDMRNSTNIFLTNLSIADLLVLLICTPTVLVELNTKPETWILGHEMCKAVPFVELTVAHASVLTILAISFERYYAICEPLKAGYVCTKTRAILICSLAWGIAALFTSPILWVAEYKFADYIDGTLVTVCLTEAKNNWIIGFYLMIIIVFFILPLFILIVLYGIIAKNLISNKGPMMRIRPIKPEFSLKARKQVVLMLGAVVVSFFLCLLPFRLLTLYIILSEEQTLHDIGLERYYNILYFCRIMLYLNSAINPILYNLMSTKFRNGFYKLLVASWTGIMTSMTCGHCGKGRKRLGTNVVATTTTNTNTTTNTSSSILSRSSNRRTSDEACQRARVQLQMQMPNGQDCEMVAMLHSNNVDVKAKALVKSHHQQHLQQQYRVNKGSNNAAHCQQHHQRVQQQQQYHHAACCRLKTNEISFEEEATVT